ncbi:MAG TPA: GtrA family protein [Verrucomicrobiae bacterium]|nr:GtrA family protein [Verrucomicrobiae bacterium]
MTPAIKAFALRLRLRQFLKFCVVGTSGLLVDMAVLHVLAMGLGWNVGLSKLCSAELAMLSNFLLNEVWTFRALSAVDNGRWASLRRLVKFQAICGVGIGFAVLLLNLFYRRFGFNLYLAKSAGDPAGHVVELLDERDFQLGGRAAGGGQRLFGSRAVNLR